MSNFQLLRNRCFLCLSPSQSSPNGETKSFKPIHKILLKYLLTSHQALNVSLFNQVLQLVGDKYLSKDADSRLNVSFCRNCDNLADSVSDLQLQLEVLQMTLVEKLAILKKIVISNSKHGSVARQKGLDKVEEFLEKKELQNVRCQRERKFLDVLYQLHDFVFENEKQEINIPLVYLVKLKKEVVKISEPRSRSRHYFRESQPQPDEGNTIDIKYEVPDTYSYSYSDDIHEDADEVNSVEKGVDFMDVDEDEASDYADSNSDFTRPESPIPNLHPPSQSQAPGKRQAALRASKRIQEAAKSLQIITSERSSSKLNRTQKSNRTRKLKTFQCELCSYKTTEICKIEHHLREHETKDKPQECTQCHTKFTQKQALKMHHIRHKFQWVCDICGAKVIQAEMKSHLTTHQNEIFNCELCDHPFGTFKGLVYHSINHPEAKLKCALCPDADAKVYKVRRDLHQHLFECHGYTELQLKCPAPDCSQVFYDRSSLTNHQSVHGKYTCNLCKGNFLSKVSLDSHKIQIHNFPKLECDLCHGKQFAHIASLKYHQQVYHGKGPVKSLQCNKCSKKYSCRKTLHIHEMSHNNPSSEGNDDANDTDKSISGKRFLDGRKIKTFVCNQCSYKTTEICKIEHHLKCHETDEKSHECSDCQLKFTHQQTLDIHLFRHEAFWKCDICSTSVIQINMEAHLKTHQEKVYLCMLCNRSFGKFSSLVVHSINHPESKLKCEMCPEDVTKEFFARRDLPRHLFECHGCTEFQLKCPAENCSQVFYDRSALSNHQSAHGRYTCNICKCQFLSKVRLASHQIQKHNFPKLECDLCPGKGFSHISSLKSHKQSHHSIGKVNTYQCAYCSKLFNTKGRLKQHELIHADTKNLSCDVCGFLTNNPGTLKIHMDRHGERKFECEHCSKTFYRKANLNDHIRIHTSEKPYQCEDCGLRFKTKTLLNSHLKMGHRDSVKNGE